MDWQDEGIILSVRAHGETSAIAEILTREHGRHMGLVHGGRGRRLRPVLQPGNLVDVKWRARLSEHLGTYSVEDKKGYAAELMQNRKGLAGLNALCAIASLTLPDRQPIEPVYNATLILVQNLNDEDMWPALYVRWESGLLKALGYGLDVSRCAATGVSENLTHVSPRSGRAVSRDAAEPYKSKLLPLPEFLLGETTAPRLEDIENGLKLMTFFIERRILWPNDRAMPESRSRLPEILQRKSS